MAPGLPGYRTGSWSYSLLILVFLFLARWKAFLYSLKLSCKGMHDFSSLVECHFILCLWVSCFNFQVLRLYLGVSLLSGFLFCLTGTVESSEACSEPAPQLARWSSWEGLKYRYFSSVGIWHWHHWRGNHSFKCFHSILRYASAIITSDSWCIFDERIFKC